MRALLPRRLPHVHLDHVRMPQAAAHQLAQEAGHRTVTARNPEYVTRLFGPDAPAVVKGCAQCAEWARLRGELRRSFDRSAETDANVLIREHLRRVHGLS